MADAAVSTRRIASFDGVDLAVHEMGAGRPILLAHGLFSSARINWVKFGHAERLADAGFRVIMPDLRGHGDSAVPTEPAGYPRDVLVRDALHLIATLGLEDYDLGGFSLGARIVAELLTAGAAPRRAVIAGMGIEGLTDWQPRRDFFLSAIESFDRAEQGDPHWLVIQFMKTMGFDPLVARWLLEATSGIESVALCAIPCPVLVVCGSEDRDNGDPAELSAALPDGRHVGVPGTHMSSVTKPELGEAMVKFLR